MEPKLQEAYNVIEAICFHYKGTKEEHKVLEGYLNLIKCKLELCTDKVCEPSCKAE